MTTESVVDLAEELEREYPDVRVGKDGCIVSKMVKKWGPYLYHVVKVKQKQKWTYLGKKGSARANAELEARNYQPDEETERVGKLEEDLD